MAGIDKTYIDSKEYIVYRQWWIGNYDKMVRECEDTVYLYPFGAFYPNEPALITPEFLKNNAEDIEFSKSVNEVCIWNTSEGWDKWLIKHCDIASYRERLLEVYPANWPGFKGQKWVPKREKKQKFKR